MSINWRVKEITSIRIENTLPTRNSATQVLNGGYRENPLTAEYAENAERKRQTRTILCDLCGSMLEEKKAILPSWAPWCLCPIFADYLCGSSFELCS